MRYLTEWFGRHLCFIDISKAEDSHSDWPCLLAWHQQSCLASYVEAIQLWHCFKPLSRGLIGLNFTNMSDANTLSLFLSEQNGTDRKS